MKEYEALIIVDECGMLRLIESLELFGDDPLDQLVEQADWDGDQWGNSVIAVGVKIDGEWKIARREELKVRIATKI